MSTQTTTRTANLPRVNLLPPEIGERKRLQQVQAGVVAAAVIAVAGVVFLHHQESHKVASARHQLTAATSENSQLAAQAATADDGITSTGQQLTAEEALLTQATNSEIQFSTYLADFMTLPDKTWLTDLSLVSSIPPGTLLTTSQAPAQTGSLSFKGTSVAWTGLATWIDGFGGVDGVTNVWFSSAVAGYIGETETVTFQATADLTPAALSGRCVKPGSCLQ